MEREKAIQTLKSLIENYEEEVDKLTEMVSMWEHYYNPGSDPGLQFEQEGTVDHSYNAIVDFCKIIPRDERGRKENNNGSTSNEFIKYARCCKLH